MIMILTGRGAASAVKGQAVITAKHKRPIALPIVIAELPTTNFICLKMQEGCRALP
jgi:hypothetical protein